LEGLAESMPCKNERKAVMQLKAGVLTMESGRNEMTEEKKKDLTGGGK
jgi:hypothetical protein